MHYAGLDVAKRTTSICVVDEAGVVVKAGKVSTEPKEIVAFLRGDHRRYRRVGLEAAGMSTWLYESLARAGLPAICIDPFYTSRVLAAQGPNKSDRLDALGIAEIMRGRLYREVHVKTEASRRGRRLLRARSMLVRVRVSVDNHIRAALLESGHKMELRRKPPFEDQARALSRKDPALARLVDTLLPVRSMAIAKAAELAAEIEAFAQADPVCRLFLAVPGVGPMTAVSFRCTIDVPQRFRRPRSVGAYLGLTPRSRNSGDTVRTGRLTRAGDRETRTVMMLAARVILNPHTGQSDLQDFGRDIIVRNGEGAGAWRKALMAVARRLALHLYEIWMELENSVAEPGPDPVASEPVETGIEPPSGRLVSRTAT